MPKTSTQSEILRLLAASPHTSAELSEICNQSQRNIRRHLLELEKLGSIEQRPNPQDRRSQLYCIANTPEEPHSEPAEEVAEPPCVGRSEHISHKTDPHICETCPLTVCDLEHDAMQIGIIDAFTAKFLPTLAESKGWERRRNPHTKVWTIYPPALHPLTLQVSVDSVTVYSSEPGDVEWIIAWFSTYFGGVHPHFDVLCHKLRHPEIYRDEQTIVIKDQPTIEALRSVSAPYADPRNRVQYIESPNTTTPGLKIYERDGTMRIEFDARDEIRARSAMVMRRELLELLPNVALRPGLFLQWRNRYYNPVIQPVIINLEQQDMVRAIQSLEATLIRLMTRIEDLEAKAVDDNLTVLIRELENMPGADLSDIVKAIRDYAGGEVAAYVFVAAWQIWELSRFKHGATNSDVLSLFDKSNIKIPMSQIIEAVDILISKKLLEQNAEHIHFTKSGVAVGKALSAAHQRRD